MFLLCMHPGVNVAIIGSQNITTGLFELGPIKNKDGDHVILNIHREAQGNNTLSQINNGENTSGCNIVLYCVC